MKVLAMVLCLVAVGCVGGDDLEDPAVRACHARADRTCAAVGAADTGFCELVMRQDCSEADAARATAMCEAHPEVAADRRDGGCRLSWR